MTPCAWHGIDRDELRKDEHFNHQLDTYRAAGDRWGRARWIVMDAAMAIAQYELNVVPAPKDEYYLFELFQRISHLHLLKHQRHLSMVGRDELEW